MDLNGKIAIITGASRGLGKVLAKRLAAEGASVVMSSNDAAELEAAAKEAGGTAIPADVTDQEQVKKLAEEAVKRFGRIDIWINNAGVWMPYGPLTNLTSERAHKLMEVNFFGTMYGSQAALGQMRKQKSGAILNIISIRAKEPRAGCAAYAASKYAQNGFTQVLRHEAEPEGIKVIGIYPSRIQTDLFNEEKPADYDKFMTSAYVVDRILENLKKEVPENDVDIKQ